MSDRNDGLDFEIEGILADPPARSQSQNCKSKLRRELEGAVAELEYDVAELESNLAATRVQRELKQNARPILSGRRGESVLDGPRAREFRRERKEARFGRFGIRPILSGRAGDSVLDRS